MGFILALVLGVMGCSETSGTGGTAGGGGNAGIGGDGGNGGTTGQEFPCTEQGIRDAIAQGGGPHTFDCDGPQTVVTAALIVIDNDVSLDGEGNLTLDGDNDHRLLSVAPGVDAELIGVSLTGSRSSGFGALSNEGTLRLTGVAVFDSVCDGRDCLGNGIDNFGAMSLTDSTVSGNSGGFNGNISNFGDLTIANSTVSGTATAIFNYGNAAVLYSTVVGDVVDITGNPAGEAVLTVSDSLLVGACICATEVCIRTSNGYNIESPGNTCGFDQTGDQASVSAEELNLGPLQDNGGPTETHALGAGSVAIDQIPAVDCIGADGAPLTTDQRGEPRPAGTTDPKKCDIGAFEVQPY